MLKEEFFACLEENVSKYMGENFRVTINKVTKNNGLILTGLMIMEEGKNAGPTIYLDVFYNEYERGKSLHEIVKKITEIYEENAVAVDLNFNFFSDYSYMKNKLVYKLINYKANENLLKEVPHRKFLDLAIVYYVTLESDVIGRGTVMIHNKHMALWNISEKELFTAAHENTPKLLPTIFSPIESIVSELFDCDFANDDVLETQELSSYDMYVVTNTTKNFGASSILYDGLLQKISKKLKGNFFILPSSIHELIIIPQNLVSNDKNELVKMVRTINENEVAIEDILSDNVYEYRQDVGLVM